MKITFASLQLLPGFRLGYLGLLRGNSGLQAITKNQGYQVRVGSLKPLLWRAGYPVPGYTVWVSMPSPKFGFVSWTMLLSESWAAMLLSWAPWARIQMSRPTFFHSKKIRWDSECKSKYNLVIPVLKSLIKSCFSDPRCYLIRSGNCLHVCHFVPNS